MPVDSTVAQLLFLGAGALTFLGYIVRLNRPYVIHAVRVDPHIYMVHFRRWWSLGTFTVQARIILCPYNAGREWGLYDYTTSFKRKMSKPHHPHYYGAWHRYLHETYGCVDPNYFEKTKVFIPSNKQGD